MTDKERKFLNDVLYEYGSAWEKGVEGLEAHFELDLISEKKDYVLHLSDKHPSKLKITAFFGKKTSRFRYTPFEIPNLPELSSDQYTVVDNILVKEKSLWMISSRNDRCIHYDLRKGYKALIDQIQENSEATYKNEKIIGLYNDPFAVFYCADSFSNYFCFWLDLEMGKLSGASSIGFPIKSGRRLLADEVAFIDSHLRKNGDFGVYGSVTQGLEIPLFQTFMNEYLITLHE